MGEPIPRVGLGQPVETLVDGRLQPAGGSLTAHDQTRLRGKQFLNPFQDGQSVLGLA